MNIIPPEIGKRKPSAFICLLDTSASMNEDTSLSSQKNLENNGFNRLDLVKHSMNTIIQTL